LVWTDPRPSSEQLKEYYREQYRQDYKRVLQPKPKHTFRAAQVAVRRCQQLALALAPGSSVLDLGAGGGELVYVLRSLGLEARGIEPNEGYARSALETLGVPVAAGFWQDADISAGSLDAVTLFHVLEHLDEPLRALELIRDWLRPGGILWIEVPNIEAVCQAPIHRFHRAHLYNFNAATLGRLGERAGFRLGRTFVSGDGGNVTAVLERADIATRDSAIPGNADRIRAVLRAHTKLRHWLSPFPYVRPMRRLGSGVAEFFATRGDVSSRNLLDLALRQARQAGTLKAS
jgi:2-polyprenyl-3-methyl-5-hydroxy-6-metoxy-1,4-benzoquinol methylase